MIYDINKRHPIGQTYVNGKRVRAVRCRTGVRGYAIVYARDAAGKYIVMGGQVAKKRLKGRVQFIAMPNVPMRNPEYW